jgi:phosphatidate cytidylyltransferase
MLKYRIITALVLIPLVLLSMFYLPTTGFAIFSAIVLLLANWEWAHLIGITSRAGRVLYLVALFFFLGCLLWIPTILVLTAASITWLGMLYYVLRYENFAQLWSHAKKLRMVLGIWLMGACWYGLNSIINPPYGPYYLLLLFLFVWGADTGAYFIGKYYGKHKLAPTISPGKSIEGVVGGVITSLFIAALGNWFFGKHFITPYVNLFLLALVTSLVSVLGDLSESMIKRQAAVKDSGNLLPGHGGVLDRMDSLLSTAPVFALMLWIGHLTL